MNVIISSVFPLEDVTYGIYDTSSRISIAYTYGCDVYANALEKSHQKQHHTKILYSVCVLHKQYTLFYAVELQCRYHENPFALGDAYLMPFYQHVQYIFVKHMEK